MDRHALWRSIERDYAEALRRSPEGFVPVVEVFVAGRATPLEIGWVRTRPDPAYPWVRFEVSRGVKPGDERPPLDPAAYWAYVHESLIERVEMTLREKPRFDFLDYRILDEEPPSSA